jgi:hypothetical protein
MFSNTTSFTSYQAYLSKRHYGFYLIFWCFLSVFLTTLYQSFAILYHKFYKFILLRSFIYFIKKIVKSPLLGLLTLFNSLKLLLLIFLLLLLFLILLNPFFYDDLVTLLTLPLSFLKQELKQDRKQKQKQKTKTKTKTGTKTKTKTKIKTVVNVENEPKLVIEPKTKPDYFSDFLIHELINLYKDNRFEPRSQEGIIKVLGEIDS